MSHRPISAAARRGLMAWPTSLAAGKLAVIAAASIAALLFAAGPAAAAGETIGGCVLEKAIHAEEAHGSLHAMKSASAETLEEFESELESCLEAPNPILPELDEIIWGGAAFLILLAFMVWKGFPAVKGAMDARSDKIRADLDAADKAKAEAMRTRSEYEAQLADAKTSAARIIEEARAQAAAMSDDLKARAEADIAEQRARAAADIESSRRQAIDDLRSEVSAIAVGAAERIVEASLDAELHRSLIDSYIDDVAGVSSNSGSGGEG